MPVCAPRCRRLSPALSCAARCCISRAVANGTLPCPLSACLQDASERAVLIRIKGRRAVPAMLLAEATTQLQASRRTRLRSLLVPVLQCGRAPKPLVARH